MSKKYKDMNDEEFDKLFRQSAENFTPPSAPEGAWDDFLTSKLSRKDEKKKKAWYENIGLPLFLKPRLSWQFASACAVIIGACLWLGLAIKKQDVKNTAVQQTAINTTKETGKNSDTLLSNNPVVIPTGKGNSAANTTLATNEEQNIFIGNGNQSGQSGYANNRNYKIENIIVGNKKYIGNNLILGILNKTALLNLKPDNYGLQNNNPVQNNPNTNTHPADNTQNSSLSNKPPVPFDYSEEVAFEQKETKKKNNNNANWQVGLVGGSNLSVAGGSVSNTPGVNTGVMLQKNINQSRFSVESGVVRESMGYAVANSDFHPNGGNVSSDVSNIRGNCTMVDIPVNVRYDVVHSKKSNAFVSTGVSTMWMANQSYSYQYGENGTSTQVNKDVSGQGKSVYAVTNVSVGFEQHFKSTSVQIAPYVKIPLGSVGYGNLNLGSIGAQISIKKSF